MAENFTKADVERIVADALKLAQAEHVKAVEELRRAAGKSEGQKEAEAVRDSKRSAQLALRNKAREVQGADVRTLKYVVGPAGAYSHRQHYQPGQVIEKLNAPDATDPGPNGTPDAKTAWLAFAQSLPSLDYAVYDRGTPKPAPEKRGPLTAAEMNKLDAERPKHGVLATKKGHRPSDTEV